MITVRIILIPEQKTCMRENIAIKILSFSLLFFNFEQKRKMKKFARRFSVTGILMTLLLPYALFSQWSTNPAQNNLICGLTGEQAIPKVATCANGDTYIGYFSNESGNYNVRLQRLDAQGNIQWATNGILISNNPQDTWISDWDMTCDNANHCILTFSDLRSSGNVNVVAYRISPAGSFVWGANGILLSNNADMNYAPKVTCTSAGNAVVAWSNMDVIIMHKISPTGTLLWGPSGITLSSANRLTWPQLLPVGTDDVILKYFDDAGSTMYPTRHVFAQRYNTAGTPVWSSPAAISTAGGITSWTQIFDFINDGSDGFYISWHDDRDNNQRASVFVQHVNSSGVPQYTANGVELSSASSMNHFYPKLACPPGSTDVYILWNEMNYNQDQWGIYGQKVNAAGAIQWGATGMIFIPVSTTNVYPYELRSSPTDVVLFYEERFTGMNGAIKAMRISNTGSFVWSPSTRTMCSVVSEKGHPFVNEFQNNQWIASWEDNRNGNADIYAQNIQLNGDMGPYNPLYGTISGTIVLSGGSGNVTQVLVQAGTYTTNPDAAGHYSMLVQTGTYTVNASLAGYSPASQSNVVVQNAQTTTVNLTLTHIPVGTIEGTVTLTNGTGNVTQVVVHAGSYTTNPDSQGHYSLQIYPGTYNMIATLPAYTPDTVYGVVVADGQTVTNVNLSLSLAPTNGLITGTVTLNGGTGNVVQTVVSAGGFNTNPNSGGFYTLDVPAGVYDVHATLTGYIPQMVPSVTVFVGQTTANINFALDTLGSSGTIQGHVTLTGGTADVTLTDVTAGGYSAHPDASGDYSLVVPAGTYSVTASNPYTTTETLTNVVVTAGLTTSGVDFTLTVNRADMICIAYTNLYPGPMNNVDVVIQGPEGPYSGTILNDSLVFPRVPYGVYNGSATYAGWGPYSSDTTIGAANHHLIFDIIIEGTSEHRMGKEMQIHPSPAGSESRISFSLPAAGLFSFRIYDAHGRMTGELRHQAFAAGDHQLALSAIPAAKTMAGGFYVLRLYSEDGFMQTCKFVYTGR
jgi:hypothetical protein